MENEEAIRRIAAWVVASDNIPEEVIDALDLAVEALNSTRKETPKTNGDRIRGMNDTELELFLPNWSYTNACKAGEHDYAGCDNECEKCVAEWLKQPYTGKERYMQ